MIWTWSPHVSYVYWETYYPGSPYVDWVATGVLNFGSIGQWSQWWTFNEIFGAKYPLLSSFGKPVMIAEFGSLAVVGNRTAWYQAALTDLPEKFPAVKALLFFNAKSDQTVTYQKLNWSITGDTMLAGTVTAAIKRWIPATAKQPR